MDKVSVFIFGFVFFLLFTNDVFGKPRSLFTNNYGGKIVGGENVTIQEVPYQVYLLLLIGVDLYQCGGSIISPKVILTAAHCLTGVSRVFIRAGSTFSDSGGSMYSSSTYIIHPEYNPATSDNDVGLVKVLKGMKLDNVTTKAISLPELGYQVPTGTDLLVSGWGDTTENGETSTVLMAVVVPTVSYEDCRKAYSENGITERMICAGVPEGGKDSCQGDSGGPAVDHETGTQLGIVSFGTGCARPGIPGVYTNVSAVRNFIRTFGGV